MQGRRPWSRILRIRGAVIPPVGLGKRTLAATDVEPKEPVQVGECLAIDWLLDEASVAGMEQVVRFDWLRASHELLESRQEPDGSRPLRVMRHSANSPGARAA